MASMSSVTGASTPSILQGFQEAVQRMWENQQKRKEKLDAINSLPHSNTLTNKPPGASPLDLPQYNTMGGQYKPPSKNMLPPLAKAPDPGAVNEAVVRLRETLKTAEQSNGLAIYQKEQSVSSFLSGESIAPSVDLQL